MMATSTAGKIVSGGPLRDIEIGRSLTGAV
jgi:hypothetical protein